MEKSGQSMRFSRRSFVMGGSTASVISAQYALASQDTDGPVRNSISSFRVHDWQDHFDALGQGIIIADTTTRALQFWTSDGEMRIFPTSVPLSDDLTLRGYTEVVEKRVNPIWAPTSAMRERNPEWPALVAGGDPGNPLGTRALYLSWQYYRIHDTHKIDADLQMAVSACITSTSSPSWTWFPSEPR